MEGIYSDLGQQFAQAFRNIGLIFSVFHIWGPFVLAVSFAFMFTRMRRAAFLAGKKKVLLDIKIPKEHDRTPLAMELAFNGIYHTYGETTWIDRQIKGQTRPYSSLEIVSIEGNVHFFIWCWEENIEQISSNIYAQYPGVEVQRVPDYTHLVDFTSGEFAAWGCEFALNKPDPYPIKTYVDYGLDNPMDEAYKADPITPVIETWGSLKKGEYMWFQMIVRAHKKKPKSGSFWGQEGWGDEADRIVNDLMFRDPNDKKPNPRKTGDEQLNLGPQLSEEEKATIAAIQRNTDKLAFDVGMRGMYIARKEAWRDMHIGTFLNSVRQYSNSSLNGFKPVRGLIPFDWPWQDFRGIRTNRELRRLIDAYKRRSYFHPPYKRPPFILSTEELATLFHFPGKVASTPTFGRIQATKAEPPSNLPI